MSETTMKLLPALLELPANERRKLVREFIDSLDDDFEDDAEARAFASMLNDRLEQFNKDPSKCLTAQESIEALRKRIR